MQPNPVFALKESEAFSYLSRHSWPHGLQRRFIHELSLTPKRFIIVDDSGSMGAGDGHRLVGDAQKKMVSSTRWAELGDSIRFHAGLAEAAGAVTEFRVLNQAAPFLIGTGDDDGSNLKRLCTVLDGSPGGGTPLCRHVNEVIQEIRGLDDFPFPSSRPC